MSCQNITLRSAALDGEFTEGVVNQEITQPKIRLEVNPNNDISVLFGVMFAEPENTCAGFAGGEIVKFLTSDAGDLKPLSHGTAATAVAIDHVIELRFVFLENTSDKIVFSNKNFVGDFNDSHGAVA